MEINFVLYGEFTPLNTFISATNHNRFKGAEIKKDNGELALYQLPNQQVTEYPVEIWFTWVTRNLKVDPDNTAFAIKYILDAMVEKGMIENDSRKHICGFRHAYAIDKDEPRVEIKIIKTN